MAKRIALAVVATALIAASPAGAADWTDGGYITDPARAANPVAIAVADSGEAAFSWSGYGTDIRPLARRRLPGQPLGATQTLFDGSASGSTIAAGEEFLTTISTPDPTANRILAQSRVGAGLTTDTIVEISGDVRICALASAVAPNGTAVVVYGTSTGGETPPPNTPCNLFARMRPARGQPFGAPVAIGATERFGGTTSVAMDADGRGFVTWISQSPLRLGATAFSPASGFAAAPQVLNVPAESPATSPPPILRIAPGGRAVVAFPSRSTSGSVHISVAAGDTSTGFTPTTVVSGPTVLVTNFGYDFDGEIGEDGTFAATWRAGKDAKARIQGLVADPTEPIDSELTEALSDYGARGPRTAVAQGRATFAWYRLISGTGRVIESSFGRPADGIGSAKRISEPNAAIGAPHVTTAKRGETWIHWGSGEASNPQNFKVLEACKLTLGNNTYSRILDVLRAPSGTELSIFYAVAATTGGGMATSVDRRNTPALLAFQLRTYGE